MAEHEPLEAWAAARAPEVLADAQREALAEARRILRDELTAALVDAARTGGRSSPARPSRASEPGRTLIWVYGVRPGGSDGPVATGLDGGQVRLIGLGGLAAIVSEVAAGAYSEAALAGRLEDLRTVEAMSRAHDGVLEDALARGDVLPFRMCTIYESDEAVRRMLADQEPTFRATLARLAGKQEWGVKAFCVPTGIPAASAASTAASGTDYLARRRAERDDAERRREALEGMVAGVHARLAERASGAVLSRPQDRALSGHDGEMVLNGAYLVPRDSAEAFAAVVDALRREHEADGLTLELTGPWPPYNFAAGRS